MQHIGRILTLGFLGGAVVYPHLWLPVGPPLGRIKRRHWFRRNMSPVRSTVSTVRP